MSFTSRPFRVLLLLVSVFALSAFCIHLWNVHRELDERAEIYRAILEPHRNDVQWRRTHVLLDESSLKFFPNRHSFSSPQSSLADRLDIYWEFGSLTQNNDVSAPLRLARNLNLYIPIVAPIQCAQLSKPGLTVVQFSVPGFSFDGQRAVVFASALSINRPPLSPEYQGALVYLKKVNGRWMLDQHPKAHGVIVQS